MTPTTRLTSSHSVMHHDGSCKRDVDASLQQRVQVCSERCLAAQRQSSEALVECQLALYQTQARLEQTEQQLAALLQHTEVLDVRLQSKDTEVAVLTQLVGTLREEIRRSQARCDELEKQRQAGLVEAQQRETQREALHQRQIQVVSNVSTPKDESWDLGQWLGYALATVGRAQLQFNARFNPQLKKPK